MIDEKDLDALHGAISWAIDKGHALGKTPGECADDVIYLIKNFRANRTTQPPPLPNPSRPSAE